MTIANIIAKTGATVAGASIVAMSLVAAVPAAAQTTMTQDQLQALINQYQSQLLALQGGSSASVTFTRDLTIGSTGSDVTALQTWLIQKGFSIPAGATGYFGAQTKAAVAAWQAANGITPAAGYFGPKSRAAVSVSVPSNPSNPSNPTSPLSGGEGSIDNFKIVGATNTSLNAADSDTVYGFEFKANGSDLMSNRVDYDVYNNNSTGALRPWNVFKTATLMNGNTTIATVDATNMNNWSEDGTASNGNTIYRVRFDGLKDVVKMGSTVDYYLMLSTQSGISDSNAGGSYKVALGAQGLRATDAMNLQQYSVSSQTWNTVSVSNSTSGSAVLSTGSDNPQTSTVQASASAQTSGVVLTTFTLQAKDADLNVYQIPATIATTSATATNIVRSFKLYQGSTLVDTESIAAGASNNFNFKNLNIRIPAGSTQSFSVQADINSVDGSTVPEGSSVAVSIATSNTAWDIENSAGDSVTPTGSVTGNAVTFKTIGVTFDTTPTTSATKSGNGTNTQETGTFSFTFNVTSFGQDIYISSTTNGYTPTGTTALYDQTGTATTTAASSITSTADRSALSNYVIHSGQTKSVTISYTKLGQSGYAYARLLTLKYGTTDANPLASSTTFTNNYQTSQIYLAD